MMGTGKQYDVVTNNCHHVTAGMPNSSVTTTRSLAPDRVVPK
jgi:hypothetical protein